MEFFKYLDAQVDYLLPRIESKYGRLYFMMAINKVKDIYLSPNSVLEGEYLFEDWKDFKLSWLGIMIGNPYKYYSMGIEVGADLFKSMKKKGFDV